MNTIFIDLILGFGIVTFYVLHNKCTGEKRQVGQCMSDVLT